MTRSSFMQQISAPRSSDNMPDMEFMELADLDEHALLADVETLLDSGVFLGLEWKLVDNLSTGSEDKAHRSKDAWKHHIYRQRQKNEREALRLQERELNQQLAQLKQAQDRATANEINPRPTSYFLTKALAIRQEEERLCAEAEQKSLTKTIIAQAKRIEAVSMVFRKRLNYAPDHSHQDQTKHDMHQELDKHIQILIQSLDWMATKPSVLHNLYATLAASYGAVQRAMETEIKGSTNGTKSENNVPLGSNSNDTSVSNSPVDHHNDSTVSQSLAVKKVKTNDTERLTYNQKQKAERASLNQQARDLTKQLNMLWRNRTAAKSARGRGEVSAAAWEALANRQLQARLVAEKKYRQLYQDVEKRFALIENLGTVFRKRARAKVTAAVWPSSKRVCSKSPDVTLCEMYAKQLDEIYGQTDDIFNEVVVEASTDMSKYYMEPRSTTRDTPYRELVGSATVPFPFARVRHVVCRCQCMISRPASETYSGPGISDTTTAVKVRIAGPRSEESASSLVQLAIMRRYDEDNRVVNVWKKCTEGEGAFAGMHCEDTGWCVVRPSLNGVWGANTVIESIVHFTSLTLSTEATSNATLTKFIDSVFNVREADCQSCGRDLGKKMLNTAAY